MAFRHNLKQLNCNYHKISVLKWEVKKDFNHKPHLTTSTDFFLFFVPTCDQGGQCYILFKKVGSPVPWSGLIWIFSALRGKPPYSASHPSPFSLHKHSSPDDSSKTELRRQELHWAEIRSQSLSPHIYSDVPLLLLKINKPYFVPEESSRIFQNGHQTNAWSVIFTAPGIKLFKGEYK